MTATMEISRKYPQPEIIELNGRLRSSRTGWNHGVAMRFLIRHQDRFVRVDELVRLFWDRVIQDHRARVRKYLSSLFKYALHQHGLVLVVEPDNNRGRAGAVKILDKASEYEQSLVRGKTNRMRARKELNETEYQLVLQLSAPV